MSSVWRWMGGLVLGLSTSGIAAATNDINSNQLAFDYEVITDQVYLNVAGQTLSVDVYQPIAAAVAPVLVYFHGGGWVYNDRRNAQLRLLPWLQKGFAVVNVDYRKTPVAHAPAAVIDARCVMNWLRQNAQRFKFDLTRIVTSGNSAGGHLALMAAYTSQQALFDRVCWDGPGPGVAAVVNWYGITDVADLLHEPNIKAYAVQWVGDAVSPATMAQSVSPLQYVAKDSAATFTIHGDRDSIVPYDHAKRLHQRLHELNVAEQLVTVTGKGHGDFAPDEVDDIYRQLWAFLRERRILP